MKADYFIEFKRRLKAGYDQYVKDYKAYLKSRGYGDHIHDRTFVERGFLSCWFAPGFHRFWQVWNPGLGYFTHRLYMLVGGNQRQCRATILVFIVSGAIHNLIFMIFLRRWCIPLPFTFLAFGLFTVVFRELARVIRFEKTPKLILLGTNIGLVIVSFEFGFRVDAWLHEIGSYITSFQ